VEEKLAARWDIPFQAVASGQFRGKAPWQVAGALTQTARGVAQARRAVRDYQPDVVFSTGGYASAPVLMAARWAGCPIVIYLPDIEPGMTIKLMSRLAERVAVSFDVASQYFPSEKVVVTGYPVRTALYAGDKAAARERLGLGGERPVLLAFGGSQGARSINQAVVRNLEALLRMAQVVHITGTLDYEWVQAAGEALPADVRAGYHCQAYLHETMIDALTAADLVVARAGASTLAEFPAVGLPAILAPYPYSGQHQAVNAAFMAKHGAAVVLADSELAGRLVDVAGQILTNAGLREEMSRRSRSLARPDASRALARTLQELAVGQTG
jgi:UDP-N-acetylglucosamine--N-acetylmuramyl-(pentapeptide) pyrophosphoryl-undecaprenol N-acetylglucosamine transferase